MSKGKEYNKGNISVIIWDANTPERLAKSWWRP